MTLTQQAGADGQALGISKLGPGEGDCINVIANLAYITGRITLLCRLEGDHLAQRGLRAFDLR